MFAVAARSTWWARWAGKTAAFAASLSLEDGSVGRGLEYWKTAVAVHFAHHVPGAALAVLDFLMDLALNGDHVVVDHRHCDADRENRDERKSHGRIGHEPESLFTTVLHG
jgi:hypothetical protein